VSVCDGIRVGGNRLTLRFKAQTRAPYHIAERDQRGAMASSCGFASRNTTRPFFI
jgi:hypothetical protein